MSTITYPTSGSYIISNRPEIEWKTTDEDSGVDESTITIQIDDGNKITGNAIVKTAISGGFKCTYTPDTALTDGQHTIKIDANDNDGNSAAQLIVNFKIDTVAPTLNLTSPVDNSTTNNADCVVSGTTNDVTSSPVQVMIQLNSGVAEEANVSENGSFSTSIILSPGVNTIKVTATDSAGKETMITRTVTLDTGAPVFHSVSIVPNPVDAGKTYIISVDVTD